MKNVLWSLYYGALNKTKLLDRYVQCDNGEKKEIIASCITQKSEITNEEILIHASRYEGLKRVSLLQLLAGRVKFSEFLLLDSCTPAWQMEVYDDIVQVWRDHFFRQSTLKKAEIVNSDGIVGELKRLDELGLEYSESAAVSLIKILPMTNPNCSYAIGSKINTLGDESLKEFIKTLGKTYGEFALLVDRMNLLMNTYLKKKRLCEEYLNLVKNLGTVTMNLEKANKNGYFLLDVIWYDFVLDEGRMEKVGQYDFDRKAAREIEKCKDLSRLKNMYRQYANRTDLTAKWDKKVHKRIGMIHALGLERAKAEKSDELLLAVEASVENHMKILQASRSAQGVKPSISAFFDGVPLNCREIYALGEKYFPHVKSKSKRERRMPSFGKGGDKVIL